MSMIHSILHRMSVDQWFQNVKYKHSNFYISIYTDIKYDSVLYTNIYFAINT